MALATVHPAAAVGFLLQQTGGEDIATRVDVFEQIYLVFLALGTLVGVIVVAYTLHKAYKYRAGAGHDHDVGRPQLGELPTGAEKGGRKLFLSFTLSAIVVVSLIAWTYGLLLYVETGTAEVPEDGVEVEVVGENFAWSFQHQDDQRLSEENMQEHVDELGEDAVLEALREAQGDDSLSYDEAIAARYTEQSEDGSETTALDVSTGVSSTGSLRIPAGREVHIDVTSGDVWHNFGISAFRVKADAIPGEVTETWFVADEPGEYRAECFELCGSGHSGMTATVTVMSQEDYDSWYQNQTIAVDELISQLEAGEFGSGEESAEDEASESSGTAAALDGAAGSAASTADARGVTAT